jgi:hypothetical protein
MYKLELFTRVRSPYIWQTRKRANAPDIVNWQSAESRYRWNNILLVYSTFFFTVYLSKHHPSQHVVASCIHDIQIHLSRLFLLRLINIDNYSEHIKSHFIYLAWVSYQLKRQKCFLKKICLISIYLNNDIMTYNNFSP